MTSKIRKYARAVALLGLLQLACGHAQRLGNRDPDAPIDPENPEVNCKLYTTIDCRPPAAW